MVSLVRAVSCLFIPFTVAAVGGGALAEDASNLIQAHVALAPTVNGTDNFEVLRSLLVTAQADLTARAAQMQLTSGTSAAHTVALSAYQLRMHEAARYMQDAIAKDNAARRDKGEPTCRAVCHISISTDALAFLAETFFANHKVKPDRVCTIGSLIYWWTTGVVTLMVDQNLTFPNALSMLSQQVSTIGYGSDTPPENSTGLKLFHGLHSVLSQMSVARATTDIVQWFLKALPGSHTPLTRTAVLLLTTAASTFLFAADLKAGDPKYASYDRALLDALYLEMISMTTVGYGDLSPMTPAGNLLTPLGLPLISNAFEAFKAPKGGAKAPKEGVAEDAPKKEEQEEIGEKEICNCLGKMWCDTAKNKARDWVGW